MTNPTGVILDTGCISVVGDTGSASDAEVVGSGKMGVGEAALADRDRGIAFP